jgi:hypothetical protein
LHEKKDKEEEENLSGEGRQRASKAARFCSVKIITKTKTIGKAFSYGEIS